MRPRWNAIDDAALRAEYPHGPTALIAERLGKSVSSTYQRASTLGLTKSAAYLATPAAGCLRPGDCRGATYRFSKGIVPHNKGLRGRKGYAPGRMAATQFKKGRAPHEASNYQPIGTERMSKDGYLERKVTDDPSLVPARRWVGVHRLVWEAAHGPIPAGHIVTFKTPDKRNIALDNLELITLRENMLRNSVHNLPKPVARAVQLLGALNRQIRRREKHA